MYKSCSRCGKIHDTNYKCNISYNKRILTEDMKLRKSKSWTNKSIEIRDRANYLCEVCKDEGIYNYKDVEVNHIVKLRHDKDKLLDNYNLICLCKKHHKQADDGKIDKDYLFRLAKLREDKG